MNELLHRIENEIQRQSYACLLGLKAEEAPHVFDGGVRIDGALQYTCSVCNHQTASPMGKDHAHELIFVHFEDWQFY